MESEGKLRALSVHIVFLFSLLLDLPLRSALVCAFFMSSNELFPALQGLLIILCCILSSLFTYNWLS